MKTPYSIDFANEIITITRKFNDAANVFNSPEYKTMMELRSLGMKIEIKQTPVRRKTTKSLSYSKMLKHISCLADAEAYLAEFEAVKAASKGESNPYRYVLNWYENRFPNHAAIPEFDENYKLINAPIDYAA